MVRRLEFGLSLRGADAGFQPADDEVVVARAALEPVAAGLDLFRHHHRHKHLGLIRDLRADEAFRRHADDGVWPAVKLYFLADDLRIAAEAAFPTAVAEHGDRMRARRLIFLRQKRATECRLHAEDVEVVAGNEIAPDALVFPAVAQCARRRRGKRTSPRRLVLRSR